MAERRATQVRLTDVASRAGVSLATVSRSLTGTPGVSEAVAERVRAVAADMGYVVNQHARSLAGGGSTAVGLLVSNIGDPYFSEIARGVIEVAADAGRTVQIAQATDDESVLAQVRLLRVQRVGAILLAGSGREPATDARVDAELVGFARDGGRVAVVGRHTLAVDAILPDNVEAGRALGRHLASLGHARVGVVAGPADLTVVTDRLTGVRDELGGRITRVEHAEFGRAGGVAAAHRILDSGTPVTAIVALNDLMAIGVLAVLRDRGIDVPGEMSVVGCDDIDVAGDLSPALTTVRLPMAEIGAGAMRLLLAAEADEARVERTSHELILRASSAPPAS